MSAVYRALLLGLLLVLPVAAPASTVKSITTNGTVGPETPKDPSDPDSKDSDRDRIDLREHTFKTPVKLAKDEVAEIKIRFADFFPFSILLEDSDEIGSTDKESVHITINGKSIKTLFVKLTYIDRNKKRGTYVAKIEGLPAYSDQYNLDINDLDLKTSSLDIASLVLRIENKDATSMTINSFQLSLDADDVSKNSEQPIPYVPLPGGGVLLASALGVGVVLRRRLRVGV